MRINIFETSLDGHRARYLREMILGIKEHSPDCLLRLCLSSDHKRDPGYVEFIEPLEESFQFCPIPRREIKGAFRSEFSRLGLLRYCIRNYPCDRIIIPFGDGLVPLMGSLPRWLLRNLVPSSIQLETMLFRCDWGYPEQRFMVRWYQRLRRWGACRWHGVRIHFSDFNAYHRATEGIDRYAADVSLVPEVLDTWTQLTRTEALAWLKSHEYISSVDELTLGSGTVVSSPGPPSLRKGTVELIEAFAQEEGFRGSLLIWGRLPSDVEAVLKSRGVKWQEDSRIIVVENYVVRDAFRAFFSLTDVIALPYQFRLGGVSSIFLLSAMHRKKTLSDNRAWMGWAAAHYGHGLSIDSSSVVELKQGLRRVIGGEGVPIATDSTAETLRSECANGHFGSNWGRA